MWLKSIGSTLLKITQIATGLGPIIGPVLPPKAQAIESQVVGELQQIGNVVLTAETMVQSIGGSLTGADKLKAALPFVSQLILQSELLAGKKIKNEEAFTRAVTAITGDFADLLNALEAK